MKTFEEVLGEEVDRHKSDLENRGCGQLDILMQSMLFSEGALFARTSPELINEILTKYMEWVDNTPKNKFADWLCEEGDDEKMDARIRKEFIEFLNQK